MPQNPFAVADRTHRPRGRWELKPGDRAFNSIVDIQLQFAMFSTAGAVSLGEPQEATEMTVDAQQFDLDVYSPLKGIVGAKLHGTPILSTFLVAIDPVPDPADSGAKGFETSNFEAALSGFVLNTLAHFYETNREGIEDTLSTDAQTWPQIINFARYIRNAAYHGNRVALRKATAPSASWHHLTITPAHDRQPILGPGRFGPGDLILLLKEFSAELDRLGVPLPS